MNKHQRIARSLRAAARRITLGKRYHDKDTFYDQFCCLAIHNEHAHKFFGQYFKQRDLRDSYGYPVGWFGVTWCERNQEARRLALLLAAEIAEDGT